MSVINEDFPGAFNDYSDADVFIVTEKIGIVFTFESKEKIKDLFIKVQLFSSSNVHIFNAIDLENSNFDRLGTFQRTMWIDQNMLNEDTYYISFHLISKPYDNPKTHLTIENIAIPIRIKIHPYPVPTLSI